MYIYISIYIYIYIFITNSLRMRHPSGRAEGAGTEGAAPRSWRAMATKRHSKAVTSGFRL